MTGSLAMLGALARVAAFALAGLALAGALLAQGGRFSPWLDLASHFAPLWLLGSLLAGAWALAGEGGGARAILLGLSGVGILAAGALIAPELVRPLSPPAPAGSPFRLRLIQFNTWDQLADPTALADWIAGEHPDVVTIEEVTGPLREALIRRGFQQTRGVESVAIFSRQRRIHAPVQIPGPEWAILPEFARATFAGPDGGAPFSVVATHLSWPNRPQRWLQRVTLPNLIDRYPRDRLILAGDFNLTPWSFALRRLDRRMGLERRDRAIPTWPARRRMGGVLIDVPALLPIDHVYAGRAWRTVSIRRGPRLGSDHYPLVVDLALAGGAQVLPAGSPTGKTGAMAREPRDDQR